MVGQQIFIGLGTGRCGTVSLSSFLCGQPNTHVIHEGYAKGDQYNRVVHEERIKGGKGDRHLFRWDGRSKEVVSYLENLGQYLGAQRFGDVGYYFLPHAEAILEKWPEAKFVVLKRERSATVESFLRKTEGRNHWMNHDGSQWQRDSKFDPTFPTLDAPSKRVAVKQYWDLYYERVGDLMKSYPSAFTLHDVHDLNEREGRREILSFLGYNTSEMKLSGTYRRNASSPVLEYIRRTFPELFRQLQL